MDQSPYSPTILRVFHDPLVSLNFKVFDPQIFLNDPKNLSFNFFNSYQGGHCDSSTERHSLSFPSRCVNLNVNTASDWLNHMV